MMSRNISTAYHALGNLPRGQYTGVFGRTFHLNASLFFSVLQNTEIAWLEACTHVRQCEMQT